MQMEEMEGRRWLADGGGDNSNRSHKQQTPCAGIEHYGVRT
jgi:hypothetical protein